MLEPTADQRPERRIRDRSKGIQLRRRQAQQVDIDRRRGSEGTAEIAAALEMYLDERKTRHAMLKLLEQWLAEARNSGPDAQDAEYVRAVERSIDIMKQATDVETGLAMLQRR